MDPTELKEVKALLKDLLDEVLFNLVFVHVVLWFVFEEVGWVLKNVY